MHELKALELEHPDLVTSDSPTQRVSGRPVEGFASVAHAEPMLSLDNAYNDDDLREFNRSVRKGLHEDEFSYVAELKVDGLGIALTYENGRLYRGVTRGDGIRGEDVTANVRAIRSIPLRLFNPPVGRVEIRGEIYLPRAMFDSLNETRADAGEPLFANPRNAAAGTMRHLDPALVARRGLHAWTYQIVSDSPDGRERVSKNQLEQLQQWALPVESHWQRCVDIDEVLRFCQEWAERRDSLRFDIDGVVVKVDDPRHRRILGSTAKCPRWAVAFKFPAEQATTKLLKIAVSIGRTGAVTPYAVLDPVRLAGSKIGMATLHNVEEVARRDIRAGDLVLIEKGGDVIPKVIKPITSCRDLGPKGPEPFVMPTVCPECETPLERPEGEVVWRCPSAACPARFARALIHFASRSAMNIEGLGESLVEQLVGRGARVCPVKRVTTFVDLYKLDQVTLESLDRIGPKSAKNLLEAIERSKRNELWRFIFGLGIRHVGQGVAKVLARTFGNLDRVVSASLKELEAVPDIGPVVAASLRKHFEQPETAGLIKSFRSEGVDPVEKVTFAGVAASLDGQIFVFTGTLASLSRSDARASVELRGGKVSSSISRKTSYVVVGEAPGSTVAKAKNLGVEVLNEETFLVLLEKGTIGA